MMKLYVSFIALWRILILSRKNRLWNFGAFNYLLCGNIALSKRKLSVLVLVQSHEWLWFTDLAMESSESPLDVLSRAATMVQDNVMPPSYGKFLLLFL